MKLGRLEILLLILIIAGAAWMASQYLPSMSGPQVCGPVPLSPEVRTYIDNKFKALGAEQCGDVTKLVSRVGEMEGKLGQLDRFRQMREQVEAKRVQVEDATHAKVNARMDMLSFHRNNELGRLRNEVAKMCSGITVRSGREDGGDSSGSSDFGGGQGGGASGGGFPPRGGSRPFPGNRRGGGGGGAGFPGGGQGGGGSMNGGGAQRGGQ